MRTRARSRKKLVGLDIEPGAITAVMTTADGRAVERAATAPLGAGVVREGEVTEPEALSRALEELFTTHKLDRNVRLGLANQRIVMRTLDLPPLESDKEINSAVQFQAQDQIPMPLDEAVLQHRSLGIVQTPEGPRTRVLLVAARREMIDTLLGSVRAAGLRPAGIDLAAFAMIRALHDPSRLGGVLYINVGGITNLAIAEDATCLFTRTITHGIESMAEQLSELRDVSLVTARAWLQRGGLDEPLDGNGADPELVLAARTTIMSGIARIADEVRNTLAFHAGHATNVPVRHAVLTGAATAIDGFADALGAELGVEVSTGLVPEAGLCSYGGVTPGRLTVAAGLTVEEAIAA